MRTRVLSSLAAACLLGACAGPPEPGGRQVPADIEEACSFWEQQAEYEIEERLDGTPASLRRLSVSFGRFDARERSFFRNIINHVWSLPLDSLKTSDYPRQVGEECTRRYLSDGGL